MRTRDLADRAVTEAKLAAALRTRLDALEADLAATQADLAAANTTIATLQSDLVTAQGDITINASDIANVQTSPVFGLEGILTVDHATTLDGLAPPHVLFTGANVHVRSGSGTTNDEDGLSGRGNLIVGYNEANTDPTDDTLFRGGSHNLVVGRQHQYTAFGGFIAGQDNVVTGNAASVGGGRDNTASGNQSSVSGGDTNTASGARSSVSGGENNTASDDHASVSGGRDNVASGPEASVSGGSLNEASGDEASGDEASVSGGSGRSATGFVDWVAGSLFEEF